VLLAKKTGWTLDVIDQMSITDINDLKAVWLAVEKTEKKAQS